MAHERWVKMVEKELNKTVYETSLPKDAVVTLLARQHRAMVRRVKKVMAHVPFDIPRDDAEQLASQQHIATCKRILATLAKQGKGGR